MQLFEYSVIFVPTSEQEKAGKRAEILIPTKTMLSKSASIVTTMASREIPEDRLGELEQIQVVVRPF